MRIQLSTAPRGVIGLVGHVGCGHAHNTNGFIQDDSAGLAALLALFQEATDLPLTIAEVKAQTGRNGSFEVVTVSGGVGRATARRGITPQEARLARAVEGQEALRTQSLAINAFGRIYGQGAHEAPVALQTAIANAALDSFVKAFPERFHHADEELPGNCGRIIGTVLDFGGITVSAMALSNASVGGIGPNEDLEGNVYLHGKKAVMTPLDLQKIPSLVIESKVFTLPVCATLSESTFMVRASEDDNPAVAQACMEALAQLGFAAIWPREQLKRAAGALRATTRSAGEKIVALGQALTEATTSAEKVSILAEIIAFASQDAGGMSFMSDRLHEIVGGVGLMPGTTAVLSLLVPPHEIERQVIPCLSDHDVARYTAVIKATLPRLHACLDSAHEILNSKAYHGDLCSLY